MENTPNNEQDVFVDGFSWEAPEYFHRQKTADWFWSFGIVTVTLIVISVVYANILFAIFIGIAALTLAIFAHRTPRNVEVTISPRGVTLEKTLYHYTQLESFWIRENDPHPKILIKSKKILMPYIVIPLGDIHPEDVRDYLIQFMEEEEQHESISQQVIEYLGF